MRISNLFRNNLFILIAILLFGLLLRISFINSSPSSLYGDELTITLDAYSLLKTGHDQLGNFLPLTFPMGAGRPAGYVYGSIPFIALFGPTALGVRALSILSGLGIILLLYFLGKQLFSEKIGILAAFLGAISPWDIALSRGGFEAHFALFLALLGIYLFLRAKENPKLYIFSALSFGLTFHTYPTYKVSLILFILLLFWFQRTKVFLKSGKKYFFGGLVAILVLILLSLSQTFVGGSEARFSDINIISQGKLKDSIEQKINLERTQTHLPKSLSKYFHNKPIEYSKVIIENYLQNFSLDFLILHGDRNPRHNMATMGEIYLIELFLIFIGILSFWQKQKRLLIFLMSWILIVPIPTATVDLPHALRSSFMLPPLLILSSLGLEVILRKKNKLIIYLILFVFSIQFIFFTQKLFFLAPFEYSNFWSYSAKVASDIAIQNKNKYDYIILSDRINDIEFAYPVYAKLNPILVISQNQRKSDLSNMQFKKFGNVFIGYVRIQEAEKFISTINGSVLFIDTDDSIKYLSSFETITGGEGSTNLISHRTSK